MFYIVGYIKDNWGWGYNYEDDTILDFTETSAHEIGHEILLAYGGQMYSKKHKGSSTLLQDFLPNTPYPDEGEIDLMKYYYETVPEDFHERVVAAKKDVLSFIWLTKMKLK